VDRFDYNQENTIGKQFLHASLPPMQACRYF
jgi:hypothetical protein